MSKIQPYFLFIYFSIYSSLYIDKKFEIKIKNDQIELFIGIDDTLDQKSLSKNFYFDFMSSYIFLSKEIICNGKNNCYLEDSRTKGPYYFNDKEIYCKRGRIFIGLNNLQSDYYFLKDNQKYSLSNTKFIMPKSQINQNIIGLAPSSQIWKYWIRNYDLQKRGINFVYNNETHYKSITFYNLEFKNRDQGIKILKQSPSFIFNLVLFLKGNNIIQKKTVSTHVSNQDDDLFMKVDISLLMNFKEILCKDIFQCEKKEDLKEVKEFEFHLKFYVNDDINRPQKLNIQLQDLFRIKDNGIIQWYIEAFTPPQKLNHVESVITLEKRFFQKFYLSITYKDNDDPFLYVNLKEVNPYLFEKNTNLSTTSLILITSFFISFLVYLLTSTFFIENLYKKKKSIDDIEEIEYLEQIIKSHS